MRLRLGLGPAADQKDSLGAVWRLCVDQATSLEGTYSPRDWAKLGEARKAAGEYAIYNTLPYNIIVVRGK